MTREKLLHDLADLRCLLVLPKRYKTPKGRSMAYWTELSRRYGNTMKVIGETDYHWYIITYDDGRRQLAYLRVLSNGLFSGAYPAIYKGIIVPRRIGYGTFAHIKKMRLAF